MNLNSVFANTAEVQFVESDVRMLVRGHVECGEERQTDNVGDGADQLGAAGAAGPDAAAARGAPALHHYVSGTPYTLQYAYR